MDSKNRSQFFENEAVSPRRETVFLFKELERQIK